MANFKDVTAFGVPAPGEPDRTFIANIADALNPGVTQVHNLQAQLLSGEGWDYALALFTTATSPWDVSYVVVSEGNVSGTTPSFAHTVRLSWEDGPPPSAPGVDVDLLLPADGATFAASSDISLSAAVSGDDAALVESVEFFEGSNLIGTATSVPWNATWANVSPGTYTITAQAKDSGGVTLGTSQAHTISVQNTATREYQASNAAAPLLMQNFASLSGLIPAQATITGIELVLDYRQEVRTRARQVGDSSPSAANTEVVFDATDGGLVQVRVCEFEGDSYEAVGLQQTAAVPLDVGDFTITETGVSNARRYANYAQDDVARVTVGGDGETFGLTTLTGQSLQNYALAVTYQPVLLTKPDYAHSGDGSIFFHIDRARLRVYFTGGGSKYFFASPDKTQIISAELTSSFVCSGSFQNGDATGVLQLTNLEIEEGTQRFIGGDWSIHSNLPPLDENQIGLVDLEDMEYNGLPTLEQLQEADSRYQFITANFYATDGLDAFYGVNGVDRAFAYNADYFYKIYTQCNDAVDNPRHIAYHHGHLALGYQRGVLDISVGGQPYNFSGDDGASTWGIGDQITGLMPLSGTVLGVFGRQSVWGLNGSTVNNFATQVISPNIGAIEYTLADMGQPVYANAYGIYTLSQTEAYGDYLGVPLSQPISPVLRPRLVRDRDRVDDVVCAIPVRSKNQYRLFFRDGQVFSMTFNGTDAAPKFTPQKYLLQQPTLQDLDYGIVPIAASSQFDETGKERIHVSHYELESPVATSMVYEMESGWSFDGNYIPHFAVLSWNFADNPFTYKSGLKTRVYGKSKGRALLSAATAPQDTDFTNRYSEAQRIDLPRRVDFVNQSFTEVSNIVDLPSRGLSIKVKFEGRNTDITRPEPEHVIQVLAEQAQGNNQRDR